jgi:hypothetical protein
MTRYWINIFDECNIVEHYPKDYYFIKYDVYNNTCYIEDENKKILTQDEAKFIMDKYNIFNGERIGVDRHSFSPKSIDEIRDIIINYYEISYTKKFLITTNLPSTSLERFIISNKCIINEYLDSEYSNTKKLSIKDNLGNTTIISVQFDDRPYDDYEPYYSKFEILQ